MIKRKRIVRKVRILVRSEGWGVQDINMIMLSLQRVNLFFSNLKLGACVPVYVCRVHSIPKPFVPHPFTISSIKKKEVIVTVELLRKSSAKNLSAQGFHYMSLDKNPQGATGR